MADRQSATTGSERVDELRELRHRLERAQAAELRAQALLQSTASLMGLSEPVEVMHGIAEEAIRSLGFQRVSVFRVDHDTGVLNEAVRLKLDNPDGEPSLPAMAPLRDLAVNPEPIEIRLGHPLAEFAMTDRTDRPLEPGLADGHSGDGLLVQMRAAARPGSGETGALVGIIVASGDDRPTERQIGLLRALASLGAGAAEAARIEEFRSKLVSAVSHELRTPLAAIRAYNELLLDEDAGPINDEQRLFLQRIETTCLHLDRMVEDLLDLSRLRAGQMVIRRSPVDVVSVIEHIMDTLSPEAARREVSLREQVVGDLPLIPSNPDRLAQVLFNLVGNAVKYVDEGGTVIVRASLSGEETTDESGNSRHRDAQSATTGVGRCMMIEVIDDGPGIAPDEMRHVFDEFFRGRHTEQTTKGSGLGLAIASRLTRLLGGVLDVESTPGEGSTFYLVFPIDAMAGEEPA